MATVGEILQADSFTGDANLGGANAPAIKIDTNPLQQLALYTNFYNKTLYDQTITDRNAKIAQISKVADIDLNNVWGKDKQNMTDSLDILKAKAAEYAKNPNRTVQDELDWQTSIGDVMNKYNSAKQRALVYNQQYNDINASADPTETKQIKINDLNKRFDQSNIDTPMTLGTGYKPVNINLPAPQTSSVDVLKVTDNKNLLTSNKVTYFDPSANAGLANNSVVGLGALQNGLSGVDKQLQGTADGEAQVWAGMKDAFNSVLAAKNSDGSYKYFDANNKFLQDKFEEDNASNTAIMTPYHAMQGMSKYSQQKISEINQGVFSDGGINYHAPSTISANNFKSGIVNFTPDGIGADKLALAGIYNKYLGDANEKKATKLGLGIEQQNANSDSSRAAQSWAELALNKEKWKAAQQSPANAPTAADNLINGVNLTSIALDVRTAYHIPQNVVAIKDGAAIDKDGNVVDFSGQITVPSGNGNGVDNSALIEYNKAYGNKVKKIVKTDPNDASKQIEETQTEMGTGNISGQGGVPVVFQNGRAAAIIADDGSPIRSSQFEKITNAAVNKDVSAKQKVRTSDYGTKPYQEMIYSRDDYKSAGWTDKQINIALKVGKIKVK